MRSETIEVIRSMYPFVSNIVFLLIVFLVSRNIVVMHRNWLICKYRTPIDDKEMHEEKEILLQKMKGYLDARVERRKQ